MARSAAARRTSELRELQTPRFKVDELGREVPDVRAEAAIIYNPETGEVLWENHSHDQRSMASITKVMTAIVFLESNTPLTNIVTVQPVDVRAASTTYLRAGYKLPAEDLLNLLLVGSDNADGDPDENEAVRNIVAKTGQSEAQARQALAARNPQQRLVQTAEVAQSVLWLCAPGSEALNGQAIAIDGGEQAS